MSKLSLNTVETIAGTTLRPTWLVPGVVPTSITSALIDKNDVCVSSVAGVSSGNGYYYALNPVPNTPDAWYINEWIAVINVNTYRARQLVHALLPGVA